MRFQSLCAAVTVTRATLLIAAAMVGALGLSFGAVGGAGTRHASGGAAASRERVPVPEPTPQALAYRRCGNVIWIFNTVWALVPAAFLLDRLLGAHARLVGASGGSGSSSSRSTGWSSRS